MRTAAMRLPSYLVISMILLTVAPASDSTWFFKIVDIGENPVAAARFLYKQSDSLDWAPIKVVWAYGESGSNGNGEALWPVREMIPNGDELEDREFAKAYANYQVFLTTTRFNDWVKLKIVAPGYQPIELRLAPAKEAMHWQRVQLAREPDVIVFDGRPTLPSGPPVANAIPPIVIKIVVGGYSGDVPKAAKIKVIDEATGMQQSAIADETGSATVRMPTPGKMAIEVACEGFKTAKWRMNVSAHQLNQSSVQLSRLPQSKNR